MGPFDRTVTTTYAARVDGYLANVARMAKANKDLANDVAGSATKNKADLDKIGNAALVAGAAMGSIFVGSVAKFATFDKAMSGVSAALDDGTRSAAALTREKEALGEAAIQAGQDTVFSAMEAAQAEAELARAGVATADILGGALVGSLDLAAAGQVSLAKSSETVAQALNIFDLAGEDATRVADTLTAGANKSAAGVEDMAAALSQGGGAAAQLNLTVEDTVGVLAAFADNALKGSDAGTSMRTMLGRLNPTTEEARAEMERLGLDFYDAQGAFVGIEEVAGQLSAALADASEEERNLAVQTIFGQDAQRGANVLIDEGAAGIRAYIDGVTDLGAAQRAAARQTDNLMGDIEELKGTLESALIRGGSGANEGIREMVQNVTALVDKFNELDPALQSGIVQAVGVSAALLLVVGAGIKATTSVLALKTSLDAAGISATRLRAIMGVAGGVALVAGVTVAALEVGKYIGATQVAEVTTEDLVDALTKLEEKGRAGGALAELFASKGLSYGPEGLGFKEEEWVSSAEVVERFAIRAQNALGDDLTFKIRRIQDFGGATTKFEETVGEMDRALADMVRNGNADKATEQLTLFLKGIGDTEVADEARGYFVDYQAALDETALAAESATTASDPLTTAIEATAEAAATAKEEVDKYLQSLVDAGLVILDQRAANREYQDALDAVAERIAARTAAEKELKEAQNRPVETDAEVKRKAEDVARLKEEVAALGESFDITTDAGQAQEAILDNVARTALDAATAAYEATGSENAFRESLERARPELVKAAEDLGLSKKRAEEFADEVLNIPPVKATKITLSDNIAPGMARAEALERKLNDLDGKVSTVTVRTNYAYSTSGSVYRSQVPSAARNAAGGGHILGPGTGTSDSIAAYLSNGEYVIKAAAVAKYGVHLFDRLNAMRFADGGLVPSHRGSAAAPTYYSTTSYGGASSVANDNRMQVERLVVEASDPRQLRRELRREAGYNADVRAS